MPYEVKKFVVRGDDYKYDYKSLANLPFSTETTDVDAEDAGKILVVNSSGEWEKSDVLSTKQDNLTFDNAPTENSTNPVTSGGVYSAIHGLILKLYYHEYSEPAENGAIGGLFYDSAFENKFSDVFNSSSHDNVEDAVEEADRLQEIIEGYDSVCIIDKSEGYYFSSAYSFMRDSDTTYCYVKMSCSENTFTLIQYSNNLVGSAVVGSSTAG